MWNGLVGAVMASALFGIVRLDTYVDDATLTASMPPFKTLVIRLDEVDTYEVRSVRPIREFGGAGWRVSKAGTALLVRTNKGLQLKLKNGRRILIGSAKPNELAAALEQALARRQH
jgi:hypothetical protein